MPQRTTPLVNREYYHVYNRGVNKQPIFHVARDFQRAMQLLEFYSFSNVKLRFSRFLILPKGERISLLASLKKEDKKLVEIICFVFMPNHIHTLLRQMGNDGIMKFMRNFQNSYAKYFNIKYKKIGPLLQGRFKAKIIEDNSQLLHLSRYIHLNPYTSYVVKDLSALEEYKWSSYPEYLGKSSQNICNQEVIMSQFKNKDAYRQFVTDRASYQRELEKIKHLLLEKL